MFLTSSNQSPCNTPEQMLTVVRPLELGMSERNKISLIEGCKYDFKTQTVSRNNYESVKDQVVQGIRLRHAEIDSKINEVFAIELEDGSEPDQCARADTRNECRRILKEISKGRGIEITLTFLPDDKVVVTGEKLKTIENEITQALVGLNLPKIYVENSTIVELLSKITKMLLESNEWISGESAFCELILSAQDNDSGESDGKSTYAVIPAHLILTTEQTGSLTIGDGDIAQVLEKTRQQGNQCKYILTNDNQEEFNDFHPSSLIAYRYWDRRSTIEETHNEALFNNNPIEQVTVEWEESSSFMNDVALLKFANDQQLATAEDTEVFPIPTRRHLELLAKRKQRIFVGDLEGTLIHNPETFGCVSKQHGLHLCFVITSKDSDGIVWELGKGSSGLIVSFKGRNGQLRPAGMLIGRLTAQVEGLDLIIYQAVVLSQALKEISDDYSLQISDYKLMQNCHQTSGTNTMINQVAAETTVQGSGDSDSDSELIGGKEVGTNYPTAKLEMANQRAVTSEDFRVSEMSQLDSGASVDGRFAMMGAKSSSYDKLEQLLTGYVRPQGRQPDTAKLQQFLQAVTSEQRYGLVTEARDGEFTVIHKAAFLDHVETISCILDSFTEEVRYKLLKVQGGMNGSTAIHFAALRGHAEAMRSMLDKVSPEHRIQLLDNRDKNNNDSLALALKHNNQQAANCIISVKGGDVSRQREDFLSNKGTVDLTPRPSLELRDEEEDMLLESSCKEIAEATSHIGDDRHSVLPNKRRTEGSLIDEREDVPPLPPRDYPTSFPAHVLKKEDREMKTKIGHLRRKVTQVEQQAQEQKVGVQKAAEELPVLTAETESHGVQLQQHDEKISGPQQMMLEMVAMITEMKREISKVKRQTQKQELVVQKAAEELPALNTTTEVHGVQLQQKDEKITGLEQKMLEMEAMMKEMKGRVTQVKQQTQKQEVGVQKAAEELPDEDVEEEEDID